jgi:hypothetical protein
MLVVLPGQSIAIAEDAHSSKQRDKSPGAMQWRLHLQRFCYNPSATKAVQWLRD